MKMQVKFFVNKMQLWSCNNKKTNPKLFKFKIGFWSPKVVNAGHCT